MTQTQLFFKDALKVNDPPIPIRMDMGEDGVGFDLVHPTGQVVASMYITYEDGDLKVYAYTAESLLDGDGEPKIITLARDVTHLLTAPLDEIDDADTVNAAENALLQEDEDLREDET